MRPMSKARRTAQLLALLVAMTTLVTVIGQEQQQLPAPSVDRVGFPEGYQQDFELLFTFDRPDNNSVRYIYGNDLAASTVPGEPYPYGSVLVMEVYRGLTDDDGSVLLDEGGRFLRGDLFGLFVQRKEPGFGEAYQEFRSGEWEYATYRPDGSALFPIENTGNCAKCHLEQGGTASDFVFRASLFNTGASGAVPTAVIQHYAFVPQVITVKQGQTVTWYNDDEVFHTVTGEGFDSGVLVPGASFSHTFDEPGTFNVAFGCTIHPDMQGTVVVEAAD